MKESTGKEGHTQLEDELFFLNSSVVKAVT